MRDHAERKIGSPLGELRLVADGGALIGVYFEDHRGAPAECGAPSRADHPILDQAQRELSEYFAGARRSFDTPVRGGGTPFQRRVWHALGRIPCGGRWSYAQLARAIGQPSAARAVGAANARNPLSIFVPCHRVIGSDRALTGYAGGMRAKQWLLDHERALTQDLPVS